MWTRLNIEKRLYRMKKIGKLIMLLDDLTANKIINGQESGF